MQQKLNENKTIFKYPCPVCDSPNQLIHEDSFDICGVCGWEDISGMRDNPDDEEIYAIYLNNSDEKPVTLNYARRMWANGETLYPDYPNPNRNLKLYRKKYTPYTNASHAKKALPAMG